MAETPGVGSGETLLAARARIELEKWERRKVGPVP